MMGAMAAERIDVGTAREMWRAGDTVIDVRSPDEYALGHIAGAINVPIDTLPKGADALPDGPVLTACGSGGRAGRAADLLDLAGRTAFTIAGGTKAWQAAGLPVVDRRRAEMTRATADRFRALHVPGEPLLLPNPWDAGSARVLAALGFKALATTSSGFAATLGRLDGTVTRDEAIAHGAAIAAATELPVSADLENGFADAPAEVADCVRAAVGAGLAGCSIEDFTGDDADPIYPVELAAERIAAAVEAAAGDLVLTARAENYLHGRADLADTIARLQRYQEAGADVLYAPGLTAAADIRAVVEARRPAGERAGAAGRAAGGRAGRARASRAISVGGAFAYAALGALAEAGREFLGEGTYGFWQRAGLGPRDRRPGVLIVCKLGIDLADLTRILSDQEEISAGWCEHPAGFLRCCGGRPSRVRSSGANGVRTISRGIMASTETLRPAPQDLRLGMAARRRLCRPRHRARSTKQTTSVARRCGCARRRPRPSARAAR